MSSSSARAPAAGAGGGARRGASSAELERMINARVRVKFAGGREMVGVLKGYDQLLNVVLDETVEYMRDAAYATRITETTRGLGLVVCRGPNITVLCPDDGMEAIANPFEAPPE